jgi:murein DD-endopeptidase MepM/ murein hydrolase activator NlpD
VLAVLAVLALVALAAIPRAAPADAQEPGPSPAGAARETRDAATPAPGVPRSPAPGAAYSWPLGLPTPSVARPFREPTHRFGPGHRGVDLAAAPGAAVLAAAAGVVVFAGWLAGRGVVSVQHPDGLRTTYEPVSASVVSGAAVVRGTVLGALEPGHAGCRGVCLHWGARRDRNTYVDPLLLLAPPRLRLLPVPDRWSDGSVSDLARPARSRAPPGALRNVGGRANARCTDRGRTSDHARGWAWSWTALSRSTVTCV